jgi:S1-C subfamily serine protease
MIWSKRQKFFGYLLLVWVGAGCGAAIGISAARWSRAGRQLALSPSLLPATVKTVANNPSLPIENLNFVSAVVDRVGGAVVKIDAIHKPRSAASKSSENDHDQQGEHGTGSGFILSADGQIVTNAHVVDQVDQVTVTLKDGRTFPGKVIGFDPVTDLAVIKVDGQGLPVVKVGDSRNLAAGAWAIAIGNPLGLDNSVTLGIISATGRSSSEVGIPDRRVRYIQADVAINPGNSGGPLLNAQGEVIGVNTAIRPDAQGLGFAIPIQTAQRIVSQLLATGKANHPYLGIKMVETSGELQTEFAADPAFQAAIKVRQGVILMGVLPNTPAAKVGLRKGDVLQKVGNQLVDSPNDVQEQVESSEIGKALALEISRDGQLQTLQIQPEIYPSSSVEP